MNSKPNYLTIIAEICRFIPRMTPHRTAFVMLKKVFSTLCFVLACSLSFRAANPVRYLPYEDLKRYHFGFFIGMHSQDLHIEHSAVPDENGAIWYGSVPSYAPGFSVGVLGDYRLTDFLSLRLSPSIHFGTKDLALVSDQAGSAIITSTVRSNYIMLPLSLRYRGARSDNYRPYLMSGFSIGLDAGRQKRREILLTTMNYYWEFGFGCDLYLPFFRLVPEIKFCLGLDDVFVHQRSDQGSDIYEQFTNAFDRMTSRLIVLSFQFE